MSDEPINIKFPLQRRARHRGEFETNDTTLDAVEDDLKILILTNHGDRPIHYDFGANLRSVLFEAKGEDLSVKIKDAIQDAIDKWMPFVNIIDVNVLDGRAPNEVKVQISFSVGNIDEIRIMTQSLSA